MMGSRIVPPKPRERLVMGRPKTRAVTRAAFAMASIAIAVGWLRPALQDSMPVLALLAGALGAGAVAAVLRIIEVPQRMVVRDRAPLRGPHVSYVRSGGANPSGPSRIDS